MSIVAGVVIGIIELAVGLGMSAAENADIEEKNAEAYALNQKAFKQQKRQDAFDLRLANRSQRANEQDLSFQTSLFKEQKQDALKQLEDEKKTNASNRFRSASSRLFNLD